MTDNEIIKALECCIDSSHFGDCFELGCPMASADGCDAYGDNKLLKSALDLINRQKEEIERLTDERETLLKECKRCGRKTQKCIVKLQKKLKTTRAEAIKEFWKELKNRSTLDHRIVSTVTGDNLVKEMVGEE